MALTLSELCKHVQKCTDRLEEETKKNIDDCHKVILANEATEVKLALEKAKDYHYKEILGILKEIITNIRKIVFHDEKIRTLNDEKSLSIDELKRYSHVQRQISIFSNSDDVTRREKRRVASEISIGSLEAWEKYLERKADEDKMVQAEKAEMQKRKRPNSKRRKKKFVSSTFNNFLDDRSGNKKLDSILEDSLQENDIGDKLTEDYVIVDTEKLVLESDFHDNDTSSSKNNCLQKALDDVDKICFGSRIELDDVVKHSKEENTLSKKQKAVDDADKIRFDSRMNLEHLVIDSKDDNNKLSNNKEVLLDIDSKPRIVDVIYKNKGN